MALAWVESSWRKGAVSEVGAVGVMQLMPNTVKYTSKKLLGLKSNLDPRNPTSNVRMELGTSRTCWPTTAAICGRR